ncbi:MAG: TonB-dependent receptor [Bacteroidales bacterium]|nr:TonB-dependent receptor [Bacteroidales bacterium]
MNKIFITIVFFLISANVFAQKNLQGFVYDKNSKEALSNVNLYLIDIQKYSTTNESGKFVFDNLNSGEYQIKITCIGYIDTSITINTANIEPLQIYLLQKDQKIGEVIVTADRRPRNLEDIPARLDVITPREVKSYPATNVDNYLQAIPNVYVNRSWGIFSKNSSVTMRGMDGTARVLVLLDGVPLNQSAGGGINWHLIESEQVEKIEVLKGPASALYGNNAMGGVINIITKKNEKRTAAGGSLQAGTYKTIGGSLNFGNNFIKNNKGVYWSGDAFYRQGDGYIIVPEHERDSTDTPLAIKEYSLNLSSGYRFNKNHIIDFGIRLYDDKRDEGIQVFEKNGSYLKYTTQNYKANYTGNIHGFNIYANAFYHIQDYYELAERLNETGDSYKLYDRNQTSKDYGVWLNIVKKVGNNDELSFGIDYKHGNFVAEDIYFTSTDYSLRGGDIDFYALFLQNDLNLLNGNLIVSAGLRADIAQFKNGYLLVQAPTPVTAFENNLSESFRETNWNNVSPKIAVRYKFRPYLHTYLSFATGFMPPKLDDMVSSRKVNTGFKIANPDLKPETLTNYELGFDIFPSDKIKLNLSAYYSLGNDFQYFEGTGDTVDIDRPVLKRENISNVEIYGLEAAINYQPADYVTLKANYTYNHSEIKKFNLSAYSGDDLSGKLIAETPPHQAYLGIFFTNKIVDINLVFNYVSEMWQDELNTAKLAAYNTLDLRLQKSITHFNFSIDIQNIFDYQYIDKKGGLAPGRFIMAKIGFQL